MANNDKNFKVKNGLDVKGNATIDNDLLVSGTLTAQTNTPSADSDVVNKAYVDAIDTHDSAAVVGQINAEVDADFVEAIRPAETIFDLTGSGGGLYTFSGDGFPSTVSNPVLHLTRGKTYKFANVSGSHPFEIRVSSGGSAYSDGVTNNGGSGTVLFTVPMNAPAELVYQCTIHSSMINTIYIDDKVGVDSDQVSNIIIADVDQTFIDQFDTHDSAAVQGQIDATIALTDTHDSAAVLGQINATVNQAFIDAFDTHDSAAVQGQIDATIATTDTHDSAAVLGQINATVNQAFIDALDTHDSAAVLGQINATIAATDTHDSAAVVNQIEREVDLAFINALDASATNLDSDLIPGLVLGTDVNGNYVADVTGTANQIEVTHTQGEGSTPVIGLPNNVTIDSDLTVNGVIKGPATMIIDPALHGDSSGTLVILGNLQVDGVSTVIQSSTVSITDKNIVLADSATNNTEANGAGITVNGANASITYVAAGDKWELNKAPYYLNDRLLTTADDTHDSAAVVGQINDVVNAAYVQGKIDQTFIDTFDTHDSAAILGQINATVNQAYIDALDTHDSAAVVGQIDSAATSYTLDFITTKGNTTTNNIEVGTINGLQVNNGNGNDATSTALGQDALINVNTGTLRNTAIGKQTLEDNISGERNVAVGDQSLSNATTGDYNVAIGQAAMGTGVVTGNYNTALGRQGLEDLTSGSYNTAMGGRGSLSQLTTGKNNVAIGPSALANQLEGNSNVAVGRSALAGIAGGNNYNNIAIGTYALDGLQGGQNNNTAIGVQAGRDLDSGTNNIIIGYNAEASATFVNNEITLGNNTTSLRIPGSSFYINGGSEGTTGSKVGIGTSSPTAQLDVTGEVFVNVLTPSTDSALATKKYVDDAIILADTHDSAAVVGQIGLEVTKTFVDALNVDADTLDGQDGTHYLDYNNFTNTPTLPAQVISYDSASELADSAVNARTDQDLFTTSDVEFNKVTSNLVGSVHFTAQNDEGTALAIGDVVYIKGISGNTPTVAKADADDAAKMPAFGIVSAGANNGANVTVTTFGEIANIDTSTLSLGDTLYVATVAGAFTATKPTGQSSLLQNVGQVTRVHASTGSIKVLGAGRTAATPNLDQNNIFIGNASNQSITMSIDSAVSLVDTHDSAAVVGQIDSAATSYTLDFVTANGNTTTNNIEVGTINGLQVDRGNGNDATSTAVGTNALINVNTGTLRNTALGQDAMANATTGGYNTAIGQAAMGSGVVTGSNNTALGADSLKVLTDGSNNMSIGRSSMAQNTTGSHNTAVGKSALSKNTTGSYNTVLGSNALSVSSSGAVSNNTAIGSYALQNLNPGQNNNIAIGYFAGRDLDSGIKNIIIGTDAEASATNMSNEITLGDDGNKSLRIPGSQFYINGGSQGTTGSKVGIGTSTPTAQLDVVGEVFVSTLTPSTDSALATKKYVDSAVGLVDTHDSAAVVGQIGLEVTKTFIDALNVDADTLDNQDGTHYLDYTNFTNTPTIPAFGTDYVDSAAARGLVSGNKGLSYNSTTGVFDIDSANIYGFTIDSARTIDLIDSAYIQPLARAAIVAGTNITYDSATGVISSTASGGGAYDSAMTGAQIDSAATAYTLDFVTANGNTTTNNIEVGTINSMQVDRGAADNATSLALGTSALVSETSGVRYNIAIGSSALRYSTTGARNVGIGYNALRGASNTADSASYNVAVGFTAMASTSLTGNFNTAVGPEALKGNTSGGFNMALGSSAMSKNTTGASNTAIGGNTLLNNLTGSSNIAIGRSALQGVGQGAYGNNTAIGFYALSGLKPDQNNNIAIGSGAGQDLDSGADNIIIGSAAEASSTLVNDEITLGNDGNRSLRIPGSSFYINGGSEGTPGSKVGIGTSSPTAQLDVVGEVFVSTLTPSTDSALATKKYVDDNAGGGGTSSSHTLAIGLLNAGLDVGDPIYYDSDATKWVGAVDSAAGVASHVVVEKDVVNFKIAQTGVFTLTPNQGLDINSYYYLGNTEGVYTTTQPTNGIYQTLFYAVDSSTIDVNIAEAQDISPSNPNETRITTINVTSTPYTIPYGSTGKMFVLGSGAGTLNLNTANFLTGDVLTLYNNSASARTLTFDTYSDAVRIPGSTTNYSASSLTVEAYGMASVTAITDDGLIIAGGVS